MGKSIMTWLDQTILALDCESTGTDPETARIITVCLGLSHEPGDWLPREIRINPGVPIPEAASAVHGITDDLVAGWPSPDALVALPVLHANLSYAAAHGIPIVAHNAAYDLTVIDRELGRHLDVRLPSSLIVLDTLVLYRRLDRQTGSRRLSQLAERHGIVFPAHDATADALACLRLLHILAGRHDYLPHIPAVELHELQIGWYAQQVDAAYQERIGRGEPGDPPDTQWPLIERPTP